MSSATLIIGNKNYSSWSFRGWLMARRAGLELTEILVPLGRPETRARILEKSPSGRVPCLIHDGPPVWDSLAIGEYLAETFPQAGLWPADRQARIHARAISNEMHAGFPTLRTSMPMNVRAILPGKGRRGDAALLARDIARIQEIWCDARTRFGAKHTRDEGFLYGHFTIADAMYVPVVSRLHTYAVDIDDVSRAYCARILADRLVREWFTAAASEPFDMPDKNL